MKKLSYLLLFCAPLFVANISNAQKDAEITTPFSKFTTFSSPEPNNLTCPKISAAEGLDEMKSQLPIVGFEKVFFSAENIRQLLSNEGCVGIRFYTATLEGQTNTSIIGVAINSNGLEVRINEEGYLISSGTGQQSGEKSINKETAQTAVEVIQKNGAYKAYSVVFSKHVIEGLLNRTNSKGIHLMPAKRKFTLADSNVSMCSTMSICAAGLVDSSSTDLAGSGEQYIKSLEPCPYVCGELSNYVSEPVLK